MQQVLNPIGYGGVSVEYRTFVNTTQLFDKYEFIPLILKDFHKGVNLKDILFYYKMIKKERPDIVHIRGAAVDGLNAEIAAKMVNGTKILVCVHGMYSDMANINPIKKFIAKHIIEPLCFSLADGISCVYEKCAKRPCFKKYSKKMLPHIYNRMPEYKDIDFQQIRQAFRFNYGIPQDGLVCLYCGRVTKEKGLSYLADALKSMNSNLHKSLYFVMVGDGEYRSVFEDEISLLSNVKYRVKFTGALTDVTPALFSSDFFILPSLHENHPISLLEAMAAELPTIATDVGGNGEILKDNLFGKLIKPADANEIEKAISDMCSEEVLLNYKTAIHNYSFDEFSPENADMQLDMVYKKILSN